MFLLRLEGVLGIFPNLSLYFLGISIAMLLITLSLYNRKGWEGMGCIQAI